ncbi:MAG TPA: SRPBCC domain-containing protein [Flavipsychrobacter sp.]|nr:SRPBCC domain-containing protein [Flavipsychrobacter sp.]
MEQKTQIQAAEGRQDLIITREFDLPVALLYRAYTEAEIVAQWMGTKVLQLENRQHGGYAFETSDPQGHVLFKAHGTIHDVIPHRLIVRTFEMVQAPIGPQLEFLEFESLDEERSRLTLHIIYRSEAHRAEELKLPFAYGINMAHDRLQEILTTLK